MFKNDMIGSFPHKVLARLLAQETRAILRRHQPEIIGITGSYGKSSAKEAIAAVLAAAQISFRKTPKNENTELGVPRTIIGGPTGSSVGSWLRTLVKGVWTLLSDRTQVSNRHAYPHTLILEMAAEYPGDISYLIDLASPKIGVLTGIGPAHSAFLGGADEILNEKSPIITKLPKDGFAILNADDARVMSLADEAKARVITYGFGASSSVRAKELQTLTQERNGIIFPIGVSAVVIYKEKKGTIALHGVLGEQHVYAAIAGIAVAVAHGIDFEVALRGLHKYESLPGRMRIIDGIKQTIIIDDSYNSNPDAATRALEAVAKIPIAQGAKRYALLGDMNELGTESLKFHEHVGRKVAELGFDFLGTVGALMGEGSRSARDAGMPEDRIVRFANAREAGKYLQEHVRPGDIILVKGSQNQIRMERAVYGLMAEPDRAAELLVRHDPEWLARE